MVDVVPETRGLLHARQVHEQTGSFSRYVAFFVGGVGLVTIALLSSSGTRGFRNSSEILGLDETGCFLPGMFYASPHKMDGTTQTVESSSQACQMRCRGVSGCVHFTFWPDGGCLLTDSSSTLQAAPYQYSETVTGPKSCTWGIQDGKQSQPSSEHGPIGSVEALIAPVAPAPGANGTVCSAYPACVAVGISEGNCCPNDDKVALGCCSGFPPKVLEVKIAAGTECSAFPACARINMTGACCPAADGTRLSCCDKITSV